MDEQKKKTRTKDFVLLLYKLWKTKQTNKKQNKVFEGGTFHYLCFLWYRTTEHLISSILWVNVFVAFSGLLFDFLFCFQDRISDKKTSSVLFCTEITSVKDNYRNVIKLQFQGEKLLLCSLLLFSGSRVSRLLLLAVFFGIVNCLLLEFVDVSRSCFSSLAFFWC